MLDICIKFSKYVSRIKFACKYLSSIVQLCPIEKH